jgi:hypothetical protein
MPAGPQCRSARAPVFGRQAMVVSGHAAGTLAGGADYRREAFALGY